MTDEAKQYWNLSVLFTDTGQQMIWLMKKRRRNTRQWDYRYTNKCRESTPPFKNRDIRLTLTCDSVSPDLILQVWHNGFTLWSRSLALKRNPREVTIKRKHHNYFFFNIWTFLGNSFKSIFTIATKTVSKKCVPTWTM